MKILLLFVASLAYSQCNSLGGTLTGTGASATITNTGSTQQCTTWTVAITTTPPVFSYTANLQGNFGSGFSNIGNTCTVIGSCTITYNGAFPNTLQLNVSAFTGGVQGLISYNISGSGAAQSSSSTNGVVLITKFPVTGSTASVSFSNIPQAFSHLQIIMSARADDATQSEGVNMRFNGDSGTTYEWVQMSNLATGPANTGQTSISICGIPAASNTAGVSGSCTIFIPNYTSTLLDKAVHSQISMRNTSVGPSPFVAINEGNWIPASPAAITSITLTPATGNFVNGSLVSLYGIN